jgi:hypothetical protein
MFTVKLYDKNGTELNIGDIVKISDGRRVHFYSEVKFIGQGILAPFHTFSFLSIEKSDLPENAVKSKEERYNIWFINEPEESEVTNEYLMSWKQCETHLHAWKIFKQ